MSQLKQEVVQFLPEWIGDYLGVTLRSRHLKLHQIADYKLVQIDNLLSKKRQSEIRRLPAIPTAWDTVTRLWSARQMFQVFSGTAP
jgi:hypothetical protein